MSAEASAVLSESEYDNFCEFFYRKTGIRFSAQKRYFVDKRIADRISDSGRDNFGVWFRNLRLDKDPEELQHLVDALTVNETYFYRETEQLDLLLGKILPEVLGVPGHPDEVRIWSMPCSSGEEPYSIALRLLEDWDEVDRYVISIFGTDIDSKMIQRARAGLYSERSVQKLGRSLRSRYFQQEKQGWRIVEELRSSIDFRRVNALERTAMRRFKDIDVIFCRNMLIYFDDLSRRKCVDALYDALRPGGYLFMGMSESLGRVPTHFDVERHRGSIVYRKPMKGGR